MEQNLDRIICECDRIFVDKGYSADYIRSAHTVWEQLKEWMEKQELLKFNENVGNEYCDTILGDHISHSDWSYVKKRTLRAIRILISVQQTGVLEFRSPRKEYIFEGKLGEWIKKYLDFMKNDLHRSPKTIEQRTIYLEKFYQYLTENKLEISNINSELISRFFEYSKLTMAGKKVAVAALSDFLKFLFEHEFTSADYSIFCPKIKYVKNEKIPTTYTEEEIRRVISVINRSSKRGKRDYLIVLLAAEFGWRAGDIVEFQFSHIDWDRNTISFHTGKTSQPVVFPLLESVGNAIIDYLKYSRPQTDSNHIIVSFQKSNYGEKMSRPNIHSIVAKYMKTANIEDWQKKKHGPHSLRHSLATNMLKRNETLPVISTVLSHQTTETTRIYLKVDTEKLKHCCLPVPELNSEHYKRYKGGN